MKYMRFEFLEGFVESYGIEWCVNRAFEVIDEIDNCPLISKLVKKPIGIILNGKIYGRSGNEIEYDRMEKP